MTCSTMVSGQGEGEREKGAHASEKRSVAWRRRGGALSAFEKERKKGPRMAFQKREEGKERAFPPRFCREND